MPRTDWLATVRRYSVKRIVVRVSVLLFDHSRGESPGCRLPIIFLPFFFWNPGRQQLAQFGEARVGFGTVMKLQAVLRKNIADAAKVCSGQAILGKCFRRSTEDLGQIHNGVARDGESEFSLALAGAFYAEEKARKAKFAR